jgi:hypothetical protein
MNNEDCNEVWMAGSSANLIALFSDASQKRAWQYASAMRR